MSATVSHRPWPLAAAASRGAPPVLARALPTAGLPGALQWELRPNDSYAPRQLLLAYGLLCAISLSIAIGFSWQGASHVLGYAGLELLLVGLALLVFARHACDGDVLTLVGASLLVEQHRGRRVERTDFAADGLRVEPAAGQGSLIEISGRGRRVRVGRYLRPERRADFARELRAALRRRLQAG